MQRTICRFVDHQRPRVARRRTSKGAGERKTWAVLFLPMLDSSHSWLGCRQYSPRELRIYQLRIQSIQAIVVDIYFPWIVESFSQAVFLTGLRSQPWHARFCQYFHAKYKNYPGKGKGPAGNAPSPTYTICRAQTCSHSCCARLWWQSMAADAHTPNSSSSGWMSAVRTYHAKYSRNYRFCLHTLCHRYLASGDRSTLLVPQTELNIE